MCGSLGSRLDCVMPEVQVTTGLQGQRKQLLIGPAKGMAVKEKCAKHANARGVWGHAPQEIFKKHALRLHLRAFSARTYFSIWKTKCSGKTLKQRSSFRMIALESSNSVVDEID